MNYTFWIPFAVLLFSTIICDKKYGMLRDITKATVHKPYSWSRVQMAWWTLIILSSFIAILWQNGKAPDLHSSILILLGISAATTASARMIDIADEEKPGTIRHQDNFGKNFFLDILSDENGVSIYRFQTLIFNATNGGWMIAQVLANLHTCQTGDCINEIIPLVTNNNLILLGLSSATYAILKSTENKSTSAVLTTKEEADTVPDEAMNSTIAQG